MAGGGAEVAGVVLLDGAADHALDDVVDGGGGHVGGFDVLAVAEDGDAVAKALDFLEAVRDVDQGDAAGLEAVDELEESLGLGQGERAGRFVHDDDAGAGADGAGDLDHLLLAGGELGHGSVDVDAGADFSEHGVSAAAHFGAVEEAEARGQAAQAEVLGHGEVGAEAEFLVDHADAGADGVERSGEVDRLAVEVDEAGVGLVDAGGDFAEGGLAGAVFTDQGVAVAGGDVETDGLEGVDAGEGLGDGFVTQDGSRCGHRVRHLGPVNRGRFGRGEYTAGREG